MYRHNDLTPPYDVFCDIMGRTLSFEIVKEKIKLCHKHGMSAIAYGAIYAASNDFYEQHKEWAFYTSAGDPYNFIDILKIMNILTESPWHAYCNRDIIVHPEGAIDNAYCPIFSTFAESGFSFSICIEV